MNNLIKKIDDKVAWALGPYFEELQLLQTMPGVNKNSATMMLC